MPAALSKITKGLSRNPRLNVHDGLDGDVCFPNEIIKPPRSYRIAAGINHNREFTKVTALTRRIVASAIARAQDVACGSSRRMAMIADVSMIILAARDRRRACPRV